MLDMFNYGQNILDNSFMFNTDDFPDSYHFLEESFKNEFIDNKEGLENKNTNDTQSKEQKEIPPEELYKTPIKITSSSEISSKETSGTKALPPIQYDSNKIISTIHDEITFDSENEEILHFVINILQNLEDIQNLDHKLSNDFYLNVKRRKRGIIKEEKGIPKLGRKRKDDTTKGDHTSESQDNILKKIKSHLFNQILLLLNGVLDTSLSPNLMKDYVKILRKVQNGKDIQIEKLLKELNYKNTVDNLRKDYNLDLLDKTLRDIISMDISSKFSTLGEDSNKVILNRIFDENDLDEEAVQIFNLTLRDFIDIVTYKKNIVFMNEKYNTLINNIKIDKFLPKIYKNIVDKKIELAKFVYLIFNYERWFFIKATRKNENNKK